METWLERRYDKKGDAHSTKPSSCDPPSPLTKWQALSDNHMGLARALLAQALAPALAEALARALEQEWVWVSAQAWAAE